MGDVISLPVDLDSDLGRALIADCARFSEGVLTEAQVRKRHRLDDATWERLGGDEKLLAEVDAEKLRRIRSGAAKREKAQQLVVKAPVILDAIMTDTAASPRHRVDAIKTLDTFAESGPKDGPAAAEMFLIRIDLSGGSGDPADIYERTITLTKPTGEPEPDAGSAPKELLPAITANKPEDGGSDEPI